MSFDPPAGEPPWISTRTSYLQKLESLAFIFPADSMGLSSFKFVQWAPKDASILQQSAGRKRILTSNSHSKRSFKVIHFAISYRPTRGSTVACRHILLLALSLKIPKKYIHSNCQKLPSSSTPLSFHAPAQGNPCEYRHEPYIFRN